MFSSPQPWHLCQVLEYFNVTGDRFLHTNVSTPLCPLASLLGTLAGAGVAIALFRPLASSLGTLAGAGVAIALFCPLASLLGTLAGLVWFIQCDDRIVPSTSRGALAGLVYWFIGVSRLSNSRVISYQGGEMMMKSVFWWWKPEYPEETTDLRQVTDETFHTYGLCPVWGGSRCDDRIVWGCQKFQE